jgi:DNA-binding transcriptional LysR family regulator
MMDWNKLQAFIALARAGNLARAAQALDKDPTTVSRQVRALEREVDCTLFEHTRDGQLLTADGRRLLGHVEAMERAAAGFAATGHDETTDSGLVRISVAEGFGTWFIAPRIGAFSELYPRISIDLVANTGFLNPSRKEADVAVLLAQPRKGPLRTRKLADYALGLYAARSMSGIAEALPLVSYIPDFIYAPELNYLGEAALDREATIRSSSINAQARIIAAGAGFGVLPCFIGDADPLLERIRPQIVIRRTFWLAVHQDVSTVPRVRAFIDWLVHMARASQSVLLGTAD